jgi:ecdysteroid 25-hydroxylase CYP306A1
MIEYWQLFLEFFCVHFDELFFAFCTTLIVSAAILDIRDKNYPPGPMGVPFLGYLPFLQSRAPYLTLTELAQQYGRIYSINLGSLYTIVISDVKMIRDAFSTDGFNGRPPLQINNGLNEGKGILGSDGESYKETRRFVGNTLQTLVHGKGGDPKTSGEPKIQRNVTEFIKDLKNHAGQPAQMDKLVRHHVGNAMAEFILGTRFEKDDKSWNYLQLVLQERFRTHTVTNSLNYVSFLRSFSKYANIFKLLKESKSRSQKVFQDIMEKKQQGQVDSANVQSVLDAYLLEIQRRGKGNGIFAADNVQHVVSDLVYAGWETTIASLSWLYLYMAVYPSIQERVALEIEQVVGKNRDVTMKDFERLHYCKAVILEIWRHRSIHPLGVPHGVTERQRIGDYWIPKGSVVLPLLYAVHHDARLWPNPEEFRPERHLNDDGSLLFSDNLLPFQIGKRACPGEDLGRRIVSLFFVNTVNQLRILSPKGSQLTADDVPDCGLTLSPQPYQLRVENRI